MLMRRTSTGTLGANIRPGDTQEQCCTIFGTGPSRPTLCVDLLPLELCELAVPSRTVPASSHDRWGRSAWPPGHQCHCLIRKGSLPLTETATGKLGCDLSAGSSDVMAQSNSMDTVSQHRRPKDSHEWIGPSITVRNTLPQV
jgi:hypothetical protein